MNQLHPTDRILFLSTALNRGGAEMQVFHLAKGLRDRGWQAEVVSMQGGDTMSDQFRDAHIPVHELGIERGVPDPRAILRLRKIIREFRPDVLHSHMVHANLLARLTRLTCPMPALISTAHSMAEGGRWMEIMYRITDPLCDLTTIICEAAANRYVKVGSVPPNRLKVLVNGLPVEQFGGHLNSRARVRQELGINDQFLWLSVGRLEPPKDYPTLIRAIAQLPSAKSTFLIAGDGPLRSQVEGLAVELNVFNRIRFLGIRKDIPALMAAADAFVMSSAWEGLPMVLLEAAASGLPIVATSVGGNAEIVREGISGSLVPPNDPSALSEALQQMEQISLAKRIAMGSAGREFVTKNYSLSFVLDQWESIYRSFMQKRSHLAFAQASAT